MQETGKDVSETSTDIVILKKRTCNVVLSLVSFFLTHTAVPTATWWGNTRHRTLRLVFVKVLYQDQELHTSFVGECRVIVKDGRFPSIMSLKCKFSIWGNSTKTNREGCQRD